MSEKNGDNYQMAAKYGVQLGNGTRLPNVYDSKAEADRVAEKVGGTVCGAGTRTTPWSNNNGGKK